MSRTLRPLATRALLAAIVSGCSNAPAGTGSSGGNSAASTHVCWPGRGNGGVRQLEGLGRRAWDELHDKERAVAHRLARTGRIVTAAAIIMVAAFSGFVAGRIAGLQEFGLPVAVFVDTTVIRAHLVPAIMAMVGRYNWWLPANVARLLGTTASPLPYLRIRASPIRRVANGTAQRDHLGAPAQASKASTADAAVLVPQLSL